MNEQQALSKMVAPGTKRPGKYRSGVIQIWLTRACNLSCYGCTQGSNLRGNRGFISLEHFEIACLSLQDYFGVVGIFGGNPCIHPKFSELCKILRDTIPHERRGLWSNNLNGHGDVCRRTFNPRVSNINVHMDTKAAEEIRRDWPEVRIVGLEHDSRHSPPYVAMEDIIPNEEVRWELIADCDINKHWSAMIAPIAGKLQAFFCEIAGAQAILHQWADVGVEVTEDWWKAPMEDFASDVRKCCHKCGVPLRAYGELSQSKDGTEQTTKAHQNIYKPKKKGRNVQVVESLDDLGSKSVGRFIDYIGNAKR